MTLRTTSDHILALIAGLLCCLPPMSATATEPQEREARYQSGPIELAATLYIPRSNENVPGVVLVHGSGSSDRSNAWMAAYVPEFTARGIAVLFPDKRGSGQSDGDWRSASFEELSDDVLAGVRFLRQQPGIDTTRIAIAGFSQGSHIAAIASQSPDVSLAISISGSVVPIREQIRDEVRIMAEGDGLSPDYIALVDSLNTLAFRYSAARNAGHLQEGTVELPAGEQSRIRSCWTDYDSLRNRLLVSEFGSTETITGFPDAADSPKFDWLGSVGLFSPLQYWQTTQIPVLFVYGARDENVDVAKSVSILTNSSEVRNLSYSLLVLGENGHGLLRYDAMDFMARWITDRGAP